MLNKLIDMLFAIARAGCDVNAVRKGKIAQRIGNRFIGKLVGRNIRWFK
jgi:hypothetical protein